ncbi:63 kDa inner membrane family protein [Striga asiatica]|uniref:63 kDa inner membrane family protein n=1 Tax=Striga asiatica TaxID=4170 RepID=A0A5A7PN19_STRAF|nr:63 kDa inner membrane family protein [Striga asiatica]
MEDSARTSAAPPENPNRIPHLVPVYPLPESRNVSFAHSLTARNHQHSKTAIEKQTTAHRTKEKREKTGNNNPRSVGFDTSRSRISSREMSMSMSIEAAESRCCPGEAAISGGGRLGKWRRRGGRQLVVGRRVLRWRWDAGVLGEVELRAVAAETEGGLVVGSGGGLGSVECAEPHTSGFLWVPNLGGPFAPRPLTDSSVFLPSLAGCSGEGGGRWRWLCGGGGCRRGISKTPINPLNFLRQHSAAIFSAVHPLHPRTRRRLLQQRITLANISSPNTTATSIRRRHHRVPVLAAVPPVSGDRPNRRRRPERR